MDVKVEAFMTMMKEVMVKLDEVGQPKTIDHGVERLTIKKIEETREEDEKDDVSFEEAVKGGIIMKGQVIKWFVDKGFGFIDVKGMSVFCHADRVVGQDWLKVGGGVWATARVDKTRALEPWRTVEAWEERRWEAEQTKKKAQEAMDVAARASKIAAQTVEDSKRMLEEAEWAKQRVGVQNIGPVPEGRQQ